jgi:hypothetical protein
MRFGRVEGFVTPEAGPDGLRLHLTVYLESGRSIDVVRDEWLEPVRDIEGPDDLTWHADQWTQETIGVDLAEQGWEVVGGGEVEQAAPGEVPKSATYAVRNLA